MATNDTMPASAIPTRPEADFYARRPDLTLIERIQLVESLLLAAPRLSTPSAKRVSLLTCEALLRTCAGELTDLIVGWGQ